MFKSKKDVDKHVEKLSSNLSVKEFKTRAYSIARLYFEVGDYPSCQLYVEQYLTQKDNNAAAYKLLGQALQKMGQKDKALEQFKTSLDIDQTQTATILDICELLADGDLAIEPGRAKYWLEKAEAIFPRHPVIFHLRERLVTMADPDPEALTKLLTMELIVRPKDPLLHARLLKHYMKTNQFKEAFDHSCNIEFSPNNFTNNYAWYNTLDELFEHELENVDKWLYQLLLLTVKERMSLLSLSETPSGSSKSLVESMDLIHAYDQALEKVARVGAAPGFAEFHAYLLQHHRGQLSFHAATLLLKRAKKNLISWSDATKSATPLMLLAWQTVPLDCKVNWLRNAPEKQLNAVSRWYLEGTYRCSQSGHYLIANYQDKNQSLLDEISQCCSGSHWKDKLYEKVFTTKTLLGKIKASYFASNAFNAPQLRLPRKIEVEAFDDDAQKEYGNSLHHLVWTLQNYKNYAHFKCTLFDMLTPTVTSCGPETLNKLDIYAFLYCAALTTQQKNSNQDLYIFGEKPNVLPANITDLLCTLSQMKWWDCAYKFSHNFLGTELTDIRATLSRGIEVVRCIDNHGLDPELLCILGRTFADRAKVTTSVEDKNFIEMRAALYYSSAIPLFKKLKSKMMIKLSDKRLFDYTHKEIGNKQLNLLLEESKLFVAVNHINDNEYEKAIEVLANVKSQLAYYHLAQAYKKLASEDNDSSTEGSKAKYETMLSKAKTYANKALDLMKENDSNKNLPLYSDTQQLIEDIEICINNIDSNLSRNVNDNDSSDENMSYHTETRRTNSTIFRNVSSTPKASSNSNNTNYRTALESQILETSQVGQRNLERIENEIKNLQKRDTTITDFMLQTRNWFEENRNMGNKIINTINNNIQNTTDQFKDLKVSVDQVKDQIDECRNECKDVGEIKKQIAELKKEVDKLKVSSEQTINETDLYSLDDEYRTNVTAPNYTAQLPFTPQMLPALNPRQPVPVPPNPYQLYNQTLYNLYNQYSHLAQSSVPGTQPLFDPARTQINFPGVYPTPDQMFLDMAHLIPPAAAAAQAAAAVPTIPVPRSLPTAPTAPSVPVVSAPPLSTSVFTSKPISSASDFKDTSRSVPVNVVITSSKPLPTTAATPAPILSVTVPQKHIKSNQPHNYQIAMPTETNVSSPPVFSFTMPEIKNNPVSTLSNWNKAFQTFNGDDSPLSKALHGGNTETAKSVVDGPFAGASPNTSLNKSRTISEKSNTSVENYDPCPDFKPIVPLPAEVKVTTGEEDETVIFSSRAKLFRFADKQWKERGLGEMKLLKHKTTGKVRVLMRREQVHKVCANHIITPDMEINPMKNETKAYIWVANDYAEEKVVLESFCIRFKTADIAKQFYDTFEKARQESEVSTTETENILTTDKSSNESVLQKAQPAAAASSEGKTVVGGFTFSSPPIFKPVKSDKTETKKVVLESNKINVFSNLAFKTSAATPFSNIFNTTPTPISKASNVEPTQESNKSKLNTSDTVEEFEPTAEFKPVIAMPALIVQKTGEEDEFALFEHRAKLLRYDSATKEWKERGLGIIKLLARKDNNQKVRLLMRREQIMKVCCNHIITNELTFKKMTNIDKAVTWCAKDFSEGQLVPETFCLRFKTAQLCDDFMKAIQTAQSKMRDDTKASKEEQNAAKQITQTGFGDEFKTKAGSWNCQGCYTNNLETYLICACCSQPKPQVVASKVDATIEPPKSSNWGDKFKPKLGSWECRSCLVRNDAVIQNCSACNSPKDPTTKKTAPAIATDKNINFSFGIPQQTAASIQNQTKAVPTSKTITPPSFGFGDKFKPKEGSWECKQCFVRNSADLENCSACNGPQKTPSIFNTTTAPSVKFSFGIAPTLTNDEKPKPESIFEGTGASKFSFGIPAMQTTGDDEKSKKPTAIIYAAPKMPTKTDGPLNFTLKNNDSKALPQTETPTQESGFGFVFKTSASNSPLKFPLKQVDDSDGEDSVKEEDCATHFNPAVPLPDKVVVVTGEENEEELYGHRARLYMYVSDHWKERGVGIVKILKHKETRKLRVVMRREQVHKICLNHALTQDITYNPKDEKTWIFAANDFSSGELSLQKFCLKFSDKNIAMQFKTAVQNALQGKPVDVEADPKSTNSDQKVDDDVVFVKETQANAEDKQKAKDLMLPENFYTYKHKEPCSGCRGCGDDDAKSDTQQTVTVTAVATSLAKQNVAQASSVTPIKPKLPSFQSPTNSIYGTPGNDKTFDTSIFRTPLGSNTVTSTPTDSLSDAGIDATNKENVFTQKSSVFSNFGDQRPKFGTPQGASPPLFVAGDAQTPVTTKSSFLAPPKLSALNVTSENKTPEVKSVQAKPAFGEPSIFSGASGISSNKSIFSFAVDKPKVESSTEVKPIFRGNSGSVNLFSSSSLGSIFGPGSLSSNNQPNSDNIGFGSGESLFRSNSNMNETKNETSKFAEICGPIPSDQNLVNELPLKLENNLFTALSTGGTHGFEKKADFKWEGTGQQLFTSGQKKGSKNDSGAGDDTGDAEEEFDPYYEPIVPLPDKIEVSTGEEEEKKIFGERAKVYRYDDQNKEWKERGVGEMKILHHPRLNTYRLLLRREQVLKAVLNMLIHPNIELLSMKNSDTAWTFGGCNFAECAHGQYEMLSVRFKTRELAISFRDRVVQCVRNLQAAAAVAIREEKEAQEKKPVTTPKDASITAPKAASITAPTDASITAPKAASITAPKAASITAPKDASITAPTDASITAPKDASITAPKDASITAPKDAPVTTLMDALVTTPKEAPVAEEKKANETKTFGSIAPLRLPKHLKDSARADMLFTAAAQQAEFGKTASAFWAAAAQQSETLTKTDTKPNGDSKESTPSAPTQVHFQEPEVEQDDEDEDDDEHTSYEDNEYDQSDYYNEEDAYYECEAEVILQNEGGEQSSCPHAHIQVLFDQDIYSPKILITDVGTSEVLADMLIHSDTEFQMSGSSCKWTGEDFTTNKCCTKTVALNFYESESAMLFYNSVETSKQHSYTTNDPDAE